MMTIATGKKANDDMYALIYRPSGKYLRMVSPSDSKLEQTKTLKTATVFSENQKPALEKWLSAAPDVKIVALKATMAMEKIVAMNGGYMQYNRILS